jgi:selenocysteine-specific elongation factor
MAKTPRYVVLGTAGHIDHGKTTLVQALTGVDTDRLPEEKRRGITIELGFAAWKIDDSIETSIVDVPGHEAFVRTMVAGAGGIDAVLLVISAEEGVMPQTREHLNVCRLLGLEHGVVALTKTDRLEGDEDSLELAVEDVRESLAGTPFADAPILPCSAKTGDGIDALRAAVKKMIKKLPHRHSKELPVLPVDRVFSMRGHGTVITGTLLSGTIDLNKDSTFTLVPTGPRRDPVDVRARGGQVRGEPVDRILAGNRTALNLGGIEVDAIERGDVLTRGDKVVRSTAVHAFVEQLGHGAAGWKAGSSLEVCAGTSHAVGHLDPLDVVSSPIDDDSDEPVIGPGGSGLVRVRLESPLPAWHGQSLVLRTFDDGTDAAARHGLTVGGGMIVDPLPSSGRAQRPRWIRMGTALRSKDPADRVMALVEDAGALGIRADEAAVRGGAEQAKNVLDALVGSGKVLEVSGGRYVIKTVLEPLIKYAVASVDRFHAASPMQPGLGRAAVEGQLPGRVSAEVAGAAVDAAIDRGLLRANEETGTLARPGKGMVDPNDLPPTMQRVADLYTRGGIAPPTLKDVQADCGLSAKEALEAVGLLQRAKLLTRVTAELSFSQPGHEALVNDAKRHLAEHGKLDVQSLKELTGLSRKFVVPFLEHLDRLGVTRRVGDERVPGPNA